jgi:hypothetical protein
LDSIVLTGFVLQVACNNNNGSAVEATESSVIIEISAVVKVELIV